MLFTWDSINAVYKLVAPPDERVTLVFDSSTALYTVTYPDGTRKIFNSTGYLTAVIDRNNNQTTLSYDGLNRITQVTDAAGRSLTFTFKDATSRQVIRVQNATGTVATYSYTNPNWPGVMTRVTYPDNSFISYNYNGVKLIETVTDTNGKLLESHLYDGSKRGTTSERANGVDRITITYPSGSLTRLTDSRGNVTDYGYSIIAGRGFVTSITGSGCASCGGRDLPPFSAHVIIRRC
jgi:YD repeat-containing protein